MYIFKTHLVNMDKHGRFKGQLPMDVSGLYTIFQNTELTADMKKKFNDSNFYK